VRSFGFLYAGHHIYKDRHLTSTITLNYVVVGKINCVLPVPPIVLHECFDNPFNGIDSVKLSLTTRHTHDCIVKTIDNNGGCIIRQDLDYRVSLSTSFIHLIIS